MLQLSSQRTADKTTVLCEVAQFLKSPFSQVKCPDSRQRPAQDFLVLSLPGPDQNFNILFFPVYQFLKAFFHNVINAYLTGNQWFNINPAVSY